MEKSKVIITILSGRSSAYDEEYLIVGIKKDALRGSSLEFSKAKNLSICNEFIYPRWGGDVRFLDINKNAIELIPSNRDDYSWGKTKLKGKESFMEDVKKIRKEIESKLDESNKRRQYSPRCVDV